MDLPPRPDAKAEAEVPVRRKPRERNPEGTTRAILAAAREEFVEHGLDGARVDRIAERAGANKRLLYHYVGNKDALYSRVLHDAYQDIRAGEEGLHLEDLPPDQGMARLVGFTFDHFRTNPWFLRLVSIENLMRARTVIGFADTGGLRSHTIQQMSRLLKRGEASGLFRAGVDPVQLYISIAGLSWMYFSNMHTLAVVFGRPLDSDAALAERRAHAIDVILSFLCRKKVAGQVNN